MSDLSGICYEQFISFLGTGVLLGVLGQGLRVVVGLQKANDEAKRVGQTTVKEFFEPREFLVSLLIGGIAGGVDILFLYEPGSIDRTKLRDFAATMLGVGYAGADFIEGFVRKNLPAAGSQPPPPTGADGK